MVETQVEEVFTVTISGIGIDIKRGVSAQKVAAVLNVIMGTEPSATAGTPLSLPSTGAGASRVSLREFLDSVGAATKPDQIVTIGHYLSVHEGKETFSRDDIKARFSSARERMPSNFPRDFGAAIKAAMIAEDHAHPGQYYVTNTGLQAVERRFGTQKS